MDITAFYLDLLPDQKQNRDERYEKLHRSSVFMAGQEWKTLFEMDETALLYGIYQFRGNAGCAIFDGMVMDVSDRIPFVTGDHHIPDRNNRLLPGKILLKAVVQSVLKGHSCNDFPDPRIRR